MQTLKKCSKELFINCYANMIFDIIILTDKGVSFVVKPDLLIRSHRRSLCLSINKQGELIVHAPMKLKIDDIFKYISEKEKWITTKQKEMQDKLSINKDIINYNQFLFLGKKYPLEIYKGIKKIELSDQAIISPPFDNGNQLFEIKKWYISNAKKILGERLEYFANLMQIDYASFKICNSKSKWGSCDNYRNIKLNFRLIMLPHKAIDYVIIHELSHIIEFSHSKEFYKIVSLVMPSYKLQQKVLKSYDYTLGLFR